MSTSSRHGGKNRKLSDHILNHKCSMERMNWKKPRTPPPPKPVPSHIISPVRLYHLKHLK